MKLTFLGTSAGEGYPAMWCHCPNCEYARTHKGRNLRRHSCALLDDDTMIDLSSHAFITALELGLDITGISTLLVTHNHQDHFEPLNLVCRVAPVSIDPEAPKGFCEIPGTFDFAAMDSQVGPVFTPRVPLDVYGHESVRDAMKNGNIHIGGAGTDDDADAYGFCFHTLQRGQVTEKGDLRFTAITAHHGDPGSVYNYIIERNGKTMLYACDCGGYDEDMFDLLKQHRYDCVVFEGTFGLMKLEDKNHQNLAKNIRMMNWFTENHLWKDKPLFVLTHIAPHNTPPYDVYKDIVAEYGMKLAWDGMTLEF